MQSVTRTYIKLLLWGRSQRSQECAAVLSCAEDHLPSFRFFSASLQLIFYSCFTPSLLGTYSGVEERNWVFLDQVRRLGRVAKKWFHKLSQLRLSLRTHTTRSSLARGQCNLQLNRGYTLFRS